MAQIIKFPGHASKLGYKRVRKRQPPESPNQLHLFPRPTAQILDFVSGLSCFEQALLLDDRGDQRAAELYSQAIEEQDCIADAYCNLGIIESQRGNTIKAFNCFSSCLKHQPRHAEAHYNLGNLYFDTNDFRLAQLHYEMAAEVDPLFANVYFNLALVRGLTDDRHGALAALDQYRRLTPGEEERHVDDLLDALKKSLATNKDSRSGSQ